MAGDFDKYLVRFSQGGRNLGKSDNKRMGWRQFALEFKKPLRTREKHSRYLKESTERKNELKGSGGWFIGAHVEAGSRRQANVGDRDIITLDLDSVPLETYESIVVRKDHWLNQFECFIHTTRSHVPEAPRLRVTLLAGTEISPEKYGPLTRIMAHYIDEEMLTVDKVSFRVAQMMYMPTVSTDQEYLFGRNFGKLVDVDEILESWAPGWTNTRLLPYAVGEEKAREIEANAEDPTEKRGVIGAFCRTYGIEDVIEKWLSDQYGDVDPNSQQVRYSYLGGHGQYGAVIYDDKFMYSWHGTDPAGEQLCNAWDLVRLHKFGHLDEKAKEDTHVNDMPSQKAMKEFAEADKLVKEQIIQDSLDLDAMFDGLPDLEDEGYETSEAEDFGIEDDESRELLGLPPKNDKTAGLPNFPGKKKPDPARKDWIKSLDADLNGKIKGHPHNLLMILTHEKRFRNMIAMNAFTGNIVMRRPLVSQIKEIPRFEIKDKLNGLMWSDSHDSAIKAILSAPRGEGQIGYGMQVAENTLQDAIRLVADKFAFNPLINHIIDGPEWDGVERISGLWVDYLGVIDNAYHRETATLFFVGALARLFVPGIAWDYVPILMGKENARKSTFVNDLAFGIWGGELSADLHNQQLAVEQMMGSWILELAEITNVKRSDAEMFKAFITRRDETVRLSYDRRARQFPRQSVFVGTTNEHTFATSSQNRRMWPIKLEVDVIDNDKLRREIAQMWAEALVEFKKRLAAVGGNTNELFFGLSPEAVEQARMIQSSIRVDTTEDTDVPAIEDFLETPVSLAALLSEDGFEDLDEDGVKVLRVSTNAKQLIEEAIGEEDKGGFQGKSRAQAIGKAMAQIGNWTSFEDWNIQTRGSKGKQLTVPGYGRGRGYVRRGATWGEIAQGYRIIETEEENLL